MECVINERLIKYEDGELYWFYTHNRHGAIKNPRWIRFKQSTSGCRKNYYKTMEIKCKKYKVHRVIYKFYNPKWNIDDNSKSNQIDHIDRDGFNNNIENLRIVTQQQNMLNRNFKGYSLCKKTNKYRVRIMLNGKTYNGGYFKTEEEAIEKREELKKQYHSIN